jgi:hypothetical protein
MKQKVFTRPVSVTLSDEMFNEVKTITDHGEIGLSDYIRLAIEKRLNETENTQKPTKKENSTMSNLSKENEALSSLSGPEFVDLLSEAQEFLKTKLAPCRNDEGVIHYWTCGVDHFDPPARYQPFKNISLFCEKKHLDWMEFKKRIEDYSGKLIFCECFIVNRVRIEKA